MADLADLSSLLGLLGVKDKMKKQSGEPFSKAYEEKKPFSEWWNWIVGPTGYSKGVLGGTNWGSINPGGLLASDWFEGRPGDALTGKALRTGLDWRKGVTGADVGFGLGSKGGGAGGGYGAAGGAFLGTTFTGGEGMDEGLMQQDWWDYISKALSLYNWINKKK